jgi:AcrR family transcriptional regulator
MLARSKLLDAATECLHRAGFANTTTSAVAEAAGVSRGAMLHHFPSKEELLVALAQRVLDESFSRYAQKLQGIADPMQRLIAIPEVVWEGMQSPAYMAWIEIWMATRSQPDLSVRLRQAYELANAGAVQSMRDAARQAGVEDVQRLERLYVLFLAAMRGLAIESAITQGSARFLPAVKEMRRVLEQALL